jgi:hypothetical protein
MESFSCRNSTPLYACRFSFSSRFSLWGDLQGYSVVQCRESQELRLSRFCVVGMGRGAYTSQVVHWIELTFTTYGWIRKDGMQFRFSVCLVLILRLIATALLTWHVYGIDEVVFQQVCSIIFPSQGVRWFIARLSQGHSNRYCWFPNCCLFELWLILCSTLSIMRFTIDACSHSFTRYLLIWDSYFTFSNFYASEAFSFFFFFFSFFLFFFIFFCFFIFFY